MFKQHTPAALLWSGDSRAANTASSNTFSGPCCVSAEHATYLAAFRSQASFSAISGVIGFCFFLASFSGAHRSALRSIWVPTGKKGVFGQCELSQALTRLSHFQMRMERPLENRLEIHLFVDNSVAIACHNPLALEYQKVQEYMALQQS